MRKYILFILLSCLAARGQTIIDLADIDLSGLPQPTQAKALRYWFDDDATTVQTSNLLSGKYSLDVSGMMEGVHTLHYQVIDNENVVAHIGSGLFLKAVHSTNLSGKSMRYWFDDDATTVQTASGTTGNYMLDVNSLIDGLHTIHYQLVDESGVVGYVGSSLFLNIGSSSGTGIVKPQKLMYWFDDETAINQVNIGEGIHMIDASALIEGLHTLHYQVLCTNGQMTPAMSTLFLRVSADAGTAVAKSLLYWFDDGQEAAETEITEGIKLLDASALTEGLHTIHYQIMDSKGKLGAPASSMFLKMDAFASSVAESIRYWFDDDATTTKVIGVANGTQTLDVSDLLTGLHTLNYQVIDNNGKVSVPVTRLFMKNFDKVLADGNNRVTKYQYWLNTNSQAMQTVELSNVTNPYQLISLLPMQKEPIHSDCFQFKITNDVPTVYAKNIFHVRFYDAQDYFSDGQKPFVDYSVKQEVKTIGELQSTQTFDKVADNAIRWYTMRVAPGDTAAFRVSQPATVQVFAPSGKEVFRTSESASVNWNGIHTWEDGTYYLAVHDVTGSQNTMTLDYMHMDKYDVVDWDVHTVGNGGCSTITFKGNGFRDLYAVDLVIAPGDTIHSVDVGHESDAETSVTFDFTDVSLGKYDAVFHFTQEDKPFANVVTVEEAVDIELATDVSFPSTFLSGTSTTYTIKITNMGNMTAYNVPIYSYLMNKNQENGISHIKIEGLDLASLLDVIDIDSLSITDRMELQEVVEELGDDHYFQLIKVEDEDSPGDSIWVRCGYFFTNIAPFETKTLRLIVTSNETVWAYISVPSDWSVFSKTKDNISSRALLVPQKVNLKDGFCCYHEKIECYLDMASLVADFVEIGTLVAAAFTDGATLPAAVIAKWTGCATSFFSSASSVSATLFCDADKSFIDKIKEQGLKNSLSAIASITATVLSCLPEELKAIKLGAKFIKELLKNWKQAGPKFAKEGIQWADNGAAFFQCRSNPKKIPNCPPDPPGGGSSNPQPPSDPNDIYGYLSESGSKYIADDVEKVNYTIEFENDPTFAEASAHTIVIKDTLDSRYFDLQSFLPTTIKLGCRETFLNEADVITQSGLTSFLKTIDMRPQINAIAQVEGTYSQKKGIAEWRFTSLDPMTMEPTDDLMQGILPVNYDGISGIGEVMYEIGVKPNKADGTKIPNRAGIVFDYEDVIMTPTWKNIVDGTAPESHVSDVQMATDTTAAVLIEASDKLSGPWRYNVYVQYGSGAWFLGAENVPIDSVARVKVYEGIDHGFYTVVTDSAGNVEQKEAAREFSFEVFAPQVDTNTKLLLAQGWNWISHNQQEVLSPEALKPKAQRIVSQTDELFKDSRFGWTGDLDELLPTELYKVQMTEADEVQLSGKLFNSTFRSVPLYEGWNWMGYPVAMTMTPAEALQKMEAEEGDFIIGQDGMTTFTEGQWTGTLSEMLPGQGYMYRSVSNKNLFLNATAQSSSRKANVHRSVVNVQYPDGWTVDKRKYPNVMGLVADLLQDGETLDANEWIVAAFSGEECRGLSQVVNGHLMMNVYGQGGESIVFMALNRESGEVVAVEESESFRTDILGTMQQPYELHSGVVNGIAELEDGRLKIENSVYDLQGRRVEKSSVGNGIYIVTDGSKTQKYVNHKRNK